MKLTMLGFYVAFVASLVGCGDQLYCQSGAKYGTQCHQRIGTEWRSGQVTKGRTVWRPKKRPVTPSTTPR